MARTILTVTLISYLSVTAINLMGAGLGPKALAASFIFLGVIFALQLRHSSGSARQAAVWQRTLTLSVQALLTYLPITVFNAQWGAMAGFLAGSLLLLMPARWAWPLYGVVGVTMLIPPALEGLSFRETVYLCQSTLLTGLVVYGLSRMAALVQALHHTRSQLAGMAVTKERLRFARDLHDLLGYSLSAITLKSELIHRLIPAHPQRALHEVQEVLTISRQSLADVRVVSSGMRRMSLEQELGSARSLLEAADVQVRTDVRAGTLEQLADSVLAAVVREAITNLLRHSRAENCSLSVTRHGDWVRLTVTNDGADPAYRDVSPHSGSGLGNLEARLRSASGRFTARHGPGGTFRLTAEVPAQPSGPSGEDGKEPPGPDTTPSTRDSAA